MDADTHYWTFATYIFICGVVADEMMGDKSFSIVIVYQYYIEGTVRYRFEAVKDTESCSCTSDECAYAGSE